VSAGLATGAGVVWMDFSSGVPTLVDNLVRTDDSVRLPNAV
jgi:hypothetical protein